jgi:hypothetical protein
MKEKKNPSLILTKVQEGHPAHHRPATCTTSTAAIPTVLAQRVRGADGHVVQEAEAVRAGRVVGAGDHARGARVVPRRADRAKGVAGFPRQHGVNSINDRARRDEGGAERVPAHGRVAVQVRDGGGPRRDGRARGLERAHVRPVMHAQDVRRAGGGGGLPPGQAGGQEACPRTEEAVGAVRDDCQAAHVFRRGFGPGPGQRFGRGAVGGAHVRRDDEGARVVGAFLNNARIARSRQGGSRAARLQRGRQGGVAALGRPDGGRPPALVRRGGGLRRGGGQRGGGGPAPGRGRAV